MSVEQDDTQSKVVAALAREADSAFETGLLHILYDLEEGESVADFFIDETRHSESSGSDEEKKAIARIDLLCETLGINPKKFSSLLITGKWTNDHRYQEVSARSMRASEREGVTVGRYVTGLAYDGLPIEYDESGDSEIEVSLRCEGEHTLSLRAFGSYWTEYQGGDEDGTSQIHWTLRYSASVEPATKAAD